MDPTHSQDASSETSGPAQDASSPAALTVSAVDPAAPGSAPGDGASVAPPAKERRWTVSRRAFTVRLGAALLAAPFVELLLPRKARAATGAPKRLVVFFTPNGIAPSRFWPSGSETSFTFAAGSVLEPLKSHQQELLVVKGLEFGEASNHAGGMAAQLTNNGGGIGGNDSKGMSVDQYVAAKIGGTTRLKSLELGVQTSIWGAGQQTRMCYRSLTEYAPPDDDPVSVYGRIFGSGSGGGTTDPETLRRKSVIDAVTGDLADLRARLGGEEARKLDQHLNSIRELERSMGVVACSGGTAPASVAKDDNDKFPTIGKTQLDLLVSALGCGATNVASLQWSFTVSPVVFSWLGITDQHHTLSHNGDGDTAGVQKWTDCERWFAQQFAYLLEKLAATPSAAGGSLLDDTLVLWTRELGDGRLHESKDVPFILAGSGAFKMGRYVQTTGKYHGQLLVSICQAMGLTNTTFGNPKYGTGPLAGL
jgi:hypothetical protein